MKKLALLLLLIIPGLACATDLTVTCTPPLKFTDGTTIPSNAAITFNLYGALQGQPKVLLQPSPLTTCSSVRQNVNPGTQCYEATAIVGGSESAHSPESCKTVTAPVPQAPGAPTLTLSTTSTVAYMELQRPDGFGFLVIGTVPLGTPCDATQGVNQYHVVPAAAVTFTGPIKRQAVLALCG